jgi:pyruvate kinase
LGPASETPEQIKILADIGMDCARINFSHGSREYRVELFNNVRKADDRIAVMCDIQGPKIRIGEVKAGRVFLQPENKIRITTEDVLGDENRISIPYSELPNEVMTGDSIFINDGIICLKVDRVENSEIECTILSGGYISSRKGVNLPSTKISLKVPTQKDIEDLELIAQLDPEYLAVSFVEDAGDIVKIRNILADYGDKRIKLISKIERPVAVENFDSILGVSDGIMVARGDLGVEIPPEDLLPVQKEMIRKCNIVGKPVIVATQMLESMMKSPVPTRAEISDVYNAIEDGADAVMLSAETASGDFPTKAVDMMERIIRISEALIPPRNPDDFNSGDQTISETIGHLVFSACKELSDIKYTEGKIICLTQKGYTARMISKYRPVLPILGITSSIRTAREMRLVWGVEPLLLPELEKMDKIMTRIKRSVEICLRHRCIEENEKLIIAGNLLSLPSRINMISIFSVDELLKMA